MTLPPDDPPSSEIVLADEAATAALGARLAAVVRPGDVIGLLGALGAGKTVLARGFIRALTGPEEPVPSPSFTLVETYETAHGPIWHIDLYRLSGADDLRELGLEEALLGLAVLVEWPERLGDLLAARRLDVTLAETADPGVRVARLEPRGGSDLLRRLALGISP